MNDKKIAFIICTNNDLYLNECLNYIRVLNVPDGFDIDLLTIKEAKSMTSGYNEGMHASDAKYKVYMHQDVFIINKNFLNDIISIFQSDEKIGMIGMVGYVDLSKNGSMWGSNQLIPKKMFENGQFKNVDVNGYKYEIMDGINQVAQIDGLMMVTSYDLEWNESELKDWDFYDAYQSLNYIENGYKIVVPTQKIPWIIHDDGETLAVWNYGKYSRKFIANYYKYFGMTQEEIYATYKREKEIITKEYTETEGKNNHNIFVLILSDDEEKANTLKNCYIKTQGILENDIHIERLQEYTTEPIYASIINDTVKNKIGDKDLLITTTRYFPQKDAIEEMRRRTNWDNCIIPNNLLRKYRFAENFVEPKQVMDAFIRGIGCDSFTLINENYVLDTKITNVWESLYT